MTWKSFQQEGFHLTEEAVDKLVPQIIEQYQDAIKSINAELKEVYATILSGIPPDEYYNTILKYDRLTKLLESVTRQYRMFSKKAGRIVANAGSLAMSNTFYQMQYTHLWLVPGLEFSLLPDDILQMSVYGSAEAWKNYQASIKRKIFGPGQLYYPQAGTLSEFLAANRAKELDNIQRAITQGLIKGDSYTKTSRAVSQVIGQFLTKDGVVNATGAMANAIRIVRTETNRIMNQASTANTEWARSQGVEVVRIWNATLDQRTRPVHAALDDKPEDSEGLFHSQVGPVRGPGQFPTVDQNANCRCTTFESVDGSRPTLRRGINVVKYEEELAKAKAEGLPTKKAEKKAAANSKEAFNYKDFEQWAADNGLKKNKFGEYYSPKK